MTPSILPNTDIGEIKGLFESLENGVIERVHEIYGPVMKELEDYGVKFIEEETILDR